MAGNDVARVSAPNTTKAEKIRRAGILARAEAEADAETKRLSSLWDPNNQSAEAMAMRDGPVESLTPDVVGMIALGKPTEWAMRAAAPYVAKGIGMVRPMFVRGGRGMRNAVVGVNDGVYVGADAAMRAGDPADIKALYEFFAATDRIPFAKMNQAERDALVKATGWQQLPTGEVVKQIPKFEFNPKTWKHYEQYATGLRRRLSKFGGSDVETALGPKSADGTVRGAYFEDVFSGPGAEQYFKYYPDARKYVMRVERNVNPKLMGEARGDEILLTDSALDRGVKQVVDTMHHEPTHIIQADSALSSGGDLSAMGNVLRGLNGATDEAGNLFVSLPLKGVPETGVNAFRENTQKMYRALMESQKLVKPNNDPALNALQRLAAADETDAKHFMYRHLGGEAGAHAVGHSASAANPPLPLVESMSEIGINPQLVYDFAPAKEVASRAYRTTDMIKNLVNKRHASLRQAAKGGDASATVRAAEGAGYSMPVPRGRNLTPDDYAGPRIVINPQVFKDSRDALCVAFDEALRVAMEEMGYEPMAEPTDEQRQFFSDTAYSDDELQLRRTILARICTFDTSVENPTDEQLQEAAEFVQSVMEAGFPQNEWEQSCLQRILTMLQKVAGSNAPTSPAPSEQRDGGTGAQAAEGGGFTESDEAKKRREENAKKLKAQGAYQENGGWRTGNGQGVIGNDEQAAQFLQAQKALEGTGAYYDNGVFRTQAGKRIGGDLESVNAFVKNSAVNDGQYYDGDGVRRTQTGIRIGSSGNGSGGSGGSASPSSVGTRSGVFANGRELTAAEAEFQRRRGERTEKGKHRDQIAGMPQESESQKRHREEREKREAERKQQLASVNAQITGKQNELEPLVAKRQGLEIG